MNSVGQHHTTPRARFLALTRWMSVAVLSIRKPNTADPAWSFRPVEETIGEYALLVNCGILPLMKGSESPAWFGFVVQT
jgi:hypothetical protein